MLAIDGVTRAYESFRLGPIELTVDDEIVAVLGPSGCGKTTLLSVVAGIERADRGTVTLEGRRLDGRPPEDRNVGLVFQDGALFPHMTARENVAYAAADGTDVESLAATLDVASLLDRSVTDLSGGERQRVALARSLAARPDALLLDEPLANLDAPIKRRLRFDLRDRLEDLDVPVIYVTHDRDGASVVGDRIAVMNDGQIQQAAAPETVFRRPSNRFVAAFTGSDNLYRATVLDRDGDGLTLSWGDHRLDAPAYPIDADEVRFCIRPGYVTVLDGDRSAEDRSNVIPGRIRRRVFEGDDYVLSFDPDGAERVEVRMSAPDYERLSLDERDRVRVSLRREAIHVLEAEPRESTVGGRASNGSFRPERQDPE